MAIQEYVIKNFMTALYKTNLQGAAALDEAISSASKGKFASTRQVIGKLKKDIRRADDPQKFLKFYCGIDLNKPSAETGEPKNISQKNFTGDRFSAENSNLQIQLSFIDENNVLQGALSFNQLTDAQKIIWQNLRDWVEQAISIVKETYGENFGFKNSSLDSPKTIYFGFCDKKNSALAETGTWNDAEGKITKALMLIINMHFFHSINSQNYRVANQNGANLGVALAHEFTHCAMAANINYFDCLPQFIKEGMAEYTCHGEITALKDGNILRLADKSALLKNGAEKAPLDVALDLADTSTGKATAYSGGYMFICYFARQVAIIFTIKFSSKPAMILSLILGGIFPTAHLIGLASVLGSVAIPHHSIADALKNSGEIGDDKINIPVGAKFIPFHQRLN